MMNAKLHVDFINSRRHIIKYCMLKQFSQLFGTQGSLHKKQKASHYFQTVWHLIIKCYASNLCVPLLWSQALLKIIICVFYLCQNVQVANYTARIPHGKRYFLYIPGMFLLRGHYYVTLFYHYATFTSVFLLYSHTNPLPHAFSVYLELLQFFFLMHILELENQHLNISHA